MTVIKCDRCGRIFDREYKLNGYTLYRFGNKIDLCSACHDKLIAFMELENLLTEEEKGAENNEP